ncbi:hypothetical protein ACH5RR_011738 [Cinchona calisaya]|uniref:DNA-directed RNA polymerase III subunit RPC5 n=1 Tax=Cinchona calisaya TaxID=153742 RepID=A0ABD3A5U6_9GENT
MSDMDFEDLDGPSQASTRPSRFAPKGSKFKPKTEPVAAPSSGSSSNSTKKQELDSKPVLSINSSTAAAAAKAEHESSVSANLASDVVAMDVDVKPEEKEQPKDEPMELGEDEIVREIDVYLTPSIDPNTKLYVLQYPLRPLWRPYELDDRCEEVRVKPGSAEVEIDLAVDVDSKNYDSDADPRVSMPKQTLTSSWKPPIAAGYAVGVLVGNKLHLNPIHAVVQLRPSMRHYKPEDSKRRNSVSSNLEDSPQEKEVKDEKPTGQLKKQGKSSATINEQNKDTGEGWIALNYHGARTDISTRYVRKMVEHDESHIQFSMSRHDYVNALCPGTSNENNRSKGPSRRVLLSVPLEERFRTWLLEGPPIHRFDALKHLAPDASVEDILEVVTKYAQLVQGLWIPRSSLVFGRDTGIDVLARDYILLLFSKTPIINSSQLPQQPQLVRAMRDVLNVLAFERSSLNDWKFREPPDTTFVKHNPKIVREQEQTWERLEKQITELVFGGKNRPAAKNSLRPLTTNNPATSKISNKHASASSNGGLLRGPMSEETREALPKALQKLFQIHKVCSFQQICQRLREMAVSESSRPKGFAREAIAAANGVDAPLEELQAIINQVAINIHGVYVLKSSTDHPQFDQFRKVVIDLFIAEGPNVKLKKASMIEAAKLQLKREINVHEYQKVVQELCVSHGSAWVLKSGDGNPK